MAKNLEPKAIIVAALIGAAAALAGSGTTVVLTAKADRAATAEQRAETRKSAEAEAEKDLRGIRRVYLEYLAREERLIVRTFASTEYMRRIRTDPNPLSTDDQKTLASSLTSEQWRDVSAANIALSIANDPELLHRVTDTKACKVAEAYASVARAMTALSEPPRIWREPVDGPGSAEFTDGFCL